MPRFAHIDLSLPDTYPCECDEPPALCRCDPDERDDDQRDEDAEYERMRDYDWHNDVGAWTDEGRN